MTTGVEATSKTAILKKVTVDTPILLYQQSRKLGNYEIAINREMGVVGHLTERKYIW